MKLCYFSTCILDSTLYKKKKNLEKCNHVSKKINETYLYINWV